MYSVKEVADIFKCHIDTIKRHIYSGDIQAVKVGRQWRISETEVERIKTQGFKKSH